MILRRLVLLLLSLVLSSCASNGGHGTIAELDTVDIELKDVDVEGGLDKAMEGYQKFLEETPESQLTPEAIRRLADLKVEKEYGVVTDEEILDRDESDAPSNTSAAIASSAPQVTTKAVSAIDTPGAKGKSVGKGNKPVPPLAAGESEKDFEKRATEQQQLQSSAKDGNVQLPKGEAGADLQNAGAEEAIRLYKRLLEKYPMYERNDQVLYQLSRAYEETGQVDEAMQVMNRLVKQFPNSRYNDEVQFRRGEYYFTRKKYLDAEEAYGESLKYGVGSVYYERALYKKGWTFYKQELYEEALHEFFTLLDYKVSIGYDFEQTQDDIERKRVNDTFRVVSLSFSNLGGSDTIQEYFRKNGSRTYEDSVYQQLAEFYFGKRRYSDAATTYNTFVESNPFHKKSPHFSMRVIEIYLKGRFPRLVIEAKKQFASTYGIHAEYWNYFNQAEFPEVLGYLKTNLTDLANHYHALYQNKKFKKDRPQNFAEASHWYREFLKSFPKDEQSPGINYQLADLLLENKDYKLAAIEYEHSAYDYPVNEKSSKAAYAAVYAYREHLKTAPASQIKDVKREIIRTSLRLVDTFPKHEKATIVLGAAVDDLFEMRDFTLAIKIGRRLIEEYPSADAKIRRGAWLVVAHSSYEIKLFHDAELAYIEVLGLTAKKDKSREGLVDNLAASIYKQGEQAREQEDYKTAVRHFLRIADLAPTSKIRPSAEYDAAAVLIQIMDLEQAATVLLSFRQTYPGHELQQDVTKKIAYVYKELGKFVLAAKEYERVAAEAKEEDLIREAMLQAAELYEKADDTDNSLRVYKKFVVMFPKPLEFALETYYKIAMIYKSRVEMQNYRDTLQYIIKTDAKAGAERTDRTRYLAAQSSLVIIEPRFDEYMAIKLVKPFKASLTKKQKSMKALVASYTKLVDYKVADVTAASTFYIAEIYYNFSRSLMQSERPDGLSDVELEEFSLMVEEQAFPFEEKAINVHEKNVELLAVGIYSSWIDRSIEKLAKLLPARYAKPEESISYITKIDNYSYSSPRYVREDASTGYVTNLDFFRYASQKLQQTHHRNNANADISIQEEKGSQRDQVTPLQAESTPADGQQAINLPVTGNTPGEQPGALQQTGGVNAAESATDVEVNGAKDTQQDSSSKDLGPQNHPAANSANSTDIQGLEKDNGPPAAAPGPADTPAADRSPDAGTIETKQKSATEQKSQASASLDRGPQDQPAESSTETEGQKNVGEPSAVGPSADEIAGEAVNKEFAKDAEKQSVVASENGKVSEKQNVQSPVSPSENENPDTQDVVEGQDANGTETRAQ